MTQHSDRSRKTGAEIVAAMQACPFPEIEIEAARLPMPTEAQQATGMPFKTDCGVLAGSGHAPSAEEIDSNRAELFSSFGESL